MGAREGMCTWIKEKAEEWTDKTEWMSRKGGLRWREADWYGNFWQDQVYSMQQRYGDLVGK